MARGFGTTFGSGSTDRITTGDSTFLDVRSGAIWTYRNGDGGGTFGRVFCKSAASSGTEVEAILNSGTTYSLEQRFSTTGGQWTIARPSLSVWALISWSYDSSSSSNDPVIYVDGSSVTVTEVVAPVGSSADVGSSFYRMGNRGDSIRAWNGMLGEWARWNRILTADEHAALGKGFSALWFRPGLVRYVPMLRANVDLFGSTPTIVGTAIQPHPRIIYPPPHRRAFIQPPPVTFQAAFARNSNTVINQVTTR